MTPTSRHYGFTLVETLVAVTIASVMSLAVIVTFQMALKLWRITSIESQTSPPAYLLVDRINKEIRGATNVTATPDAVDPTSTDLTINLADIVNGVDAVNSTSGQLTSSHWVKYTLAINPNGVNGGKYLYRQTDAGSTLHLIADNVIQFHCKLNAEGIDPTTKVNHILSATTTALTVEGHESGDTYLKSHQLKVNASTTPISETVYLRYDLNPNGPNLPNTN